MVVSKEREEKKKERKKRNRRGDLHNLPTQRNKNQTESSPALGSLET
jgi:hypothetical protein